jgi:DNA modification methylase
MNKLDMERKSQEILARVSRLEPSQSWAFSDAGRSETNYITHGYHRYPAKFIPNLVKKLIETYTEPGDIIVDTFGGCGTTLVEAKMSGRRSYGFDINPVAKLITQTKITPIRPEVLDATLVDFIRSLGSTNSLPPEIRFERLTYWFDSEKLVELNHIYTTIKTINDKKVRRFYLCAFSHILKNCSRWLMKSTKPTIDRDKIAAEPTDAFIHHLRFMMKRNSQFYKRLTDDGNLSTKSDMRIANSTKKLPLKSASVDLIVTSPPYVTSYEYADLHQLSLLWFGNDRDTFKTWGHHVTDFKGFRKKFVGTSIIENKRRQLLNSQIADDTIAQLKSQDKSLSNGVYNYYADMYKSFAEMYRILKPGKNACIIIGNTTMKSVHVANAEVALEQMRGLGFQQIRLIKREIINKSITPWRDTLSGRFTGLANSNRGRVYQYEYILVMRKPISTTS